MRALLEAGAQALAMEVSSIGLEQGRVFGMHYDVALFTNLTRDHLDYHGTMERYEAAKATPVRVAGLRHAVVNLDDPAGQRIAARLACAAASGIKVIGTTAMDAEPATLVDALLGAQPAGDGGRARLRALRRRSEPVEVEVPLVGQFNVANLLGVVAVALAAGVPSRAVVRCPAGAAARAHAARRWRRRAAGRSSTTRTRRMHSPRR